MRWFFWLNVCGALSAVYHFCGRLPARPGDVVQVLAIVRNVTTDFGQPVLGCSYVRLGHNSDNSDTPDTLANFVELKSNCNKPKSFGSISECQAKPSVLPVLVPVSADAESLRVHIGLTFDAFVLENEPSRCIVLSHVPSTGYRFFLTLLSCIGIGLLPLLAIALTSLYTEGARIEEHAARLLDSKKFKQQ